MALVHEVLYRSKQLSQVDFGEYTRSIVALLFQSYGTRSSPVSVRTEIKDVRLGIDVAVPCALLINELLSNALKHAFPEPRSAASAAGDQIVIQFAPRGDDYELVVADNGVGPPPSFDPTRASTLGLQLVATLVRQLEGSYEIRAEGGTAFRIRFPQSKRP